MYLCNCVSMYLFICVLHTHMYTRGACGGLSWAQVPELSLHLHSAVVTTLCKRCSHIAAMCTNIINCFSKSHFSCACLPSYDITGRQFEWFKIVKSKSQQLNSSQLNVCPGGGGGWGVGASAPDGECGEKFCRGLSLSSTDALHWMQEEVLRPRARYYTSMHSMHITEVCTPRHHGLAGLHLAGHWAVQWVAIRRGVGSRQH